LAIKHALDFANAWQIFDAPMVVDIDNRENYGEIRFIGFGFLKNFVVVIVSANPTKKRFALFLYAKH
jgi:uncharacterized protein